MEQSSRIKNTVRNMVWASMSRITAIVFPFIVRTVFIKVLGEEYLGLNTLFSSILQVLNLTDLGFASAIVASMYKPIAENNESDICALLNLYRNIYKVIGITILVIGIILTPFLDYLISGTPPEAVNIYFLWILFLINTVISYLLFAYKVSLLNAHQRSDLTEKIGVVCRIITGLVQILIVIFLKNFYLYVALNIVCVTSYNIACSFECKKRYPSYKCKGVLGQDLKKKIKKNLGALAVQKIGNTISLSLDSVIISAFLGLTTVAIYGNYYYIISAIGTFVALIYSASTASIGNSIASENVEKNYNDLKKIFFLSSWIIGWCAICLTCLFQDFMTLWVGDKLLFSMPVILTLIFRFYFEQIRKIVISYKDAAGMWWVDRWRPLVGCAVNLLLNIILVKSIGVAGVAISTIISYVFIELPWETHALFKNYFKRSELEYYKEMLISMFTMFVSGMITYSICMMIPLAGIKTLAVKSVICVLIPNLIFVSMNLKNHEFKAGRELFKKIVKAYQ